MFEKKIGAYVKDSAEKSYEKTIRVGKFDKVCFTNLLYQQLIDSVVDYLRHHQISKWSRTGKCIQTDFQSTFIAVKTKQEVQEAHFIVNSTPCTAPLFSIKIISLSTIYLMAQHMIQVLFTKSEGHFPSLEDLWRDHHNKDQECFKTI